MALNESGIAFAVRAMRMTEVPVVMESPKWRPGSNSTARRDASKPDVALDCQQCGGRRNLAVPVGMGASGLGWSSSWNSNVNGLSLPYESDRRTYRGRIRWPRHLRHVIEEWVLLIGPIQFMP